MLFRSRTMTLEVLRQDYIRTAWAKGLAEPIVILRHALRNALIPVVTLVGLQAPLLIGGAVATWMTVYWWSVVAPALATVIP